MPPEVRLRWVLKEASSGFGKSSNEDLSDRVPEYRNLCALICQIAANG